MKMTDEPHPIIYLEPPCCADPDTGQMWCQDADVFDGCEDHPPTMYLLASNVEKTIEALAEPIAQRQLAACNALLDQLLSLTPGDSIDITGSLQDALNRRPQGVTIQ